MQEQKAIALKGLFRNNKLVKVEILIVDTLEITELTREKFPKTLEKIEKLILRKNPDEDIVITKSEKVKVELVKDENIRKLKEKALRTEKDTQTDTAKFINTKEVV